MSAVVAAKGTVGVWKGTVGVWKGTVGGWGHGKGPHREGGRCGPCLIRVPRN